MNPEMSCLSTIERTMKTLAPQRSPRLFNEFLVRGYTAISLDTLPRAAFPSLLQAKLCLGALITLYDDFADRPSQLDPQLLDHLYRLNFTSRPLTPELDLELEQRRVFEFAQSLFSRIHGVLSQLPNYSRLGSILHFDLEQFYTANRFSSLLTAFPEMRNRLENRLYVHHNMGMVLAAMMDLMAIERVQFQELGAMREVFLLGQRMGRIFNVLTTRERENRDCDVTGELAVCANELQMQKAKGLLEEEILDLKIKIKALQPQVSTFSVTFYLSGLTKVQNLHKKMKRDL